MLAMSWNIYEPHAMRRRTRHSREIERLNSTNDDETEWKKTLTHTRIKSIPQMTLFKVKNWSYRAYFFSLLLRPIINLIQKTSTYLFSPEFIQYHHFCNNKKVIQSCDSSFNAEDVFVFIVKTASNCSINSFHSHLLSFQVILLAPHEL